MTSTLERPALRAPVRRKQPERGLLAPGMLAAAWAAGAGLVTLGLPVLLAWATDSRSGSGAAAATKAIGQLWLLAQGATMTVPGGHVGITPLGLTVLPLALLHRAGRHAARSAEVSTTRSGARLVAAAAIPYAVGCALVAALCATDAIRPAPGQALLGGFVVAVVGVGSGVVREGRLRKAIAKRVAPRARWLVRATCAAAGVLLAGGAVLTGLSFLLHAGRATSLAAASDPGLVGGLTLFATSLALVPNAALWGAAWLAGPGFAVGVGTAVGPFGTSLGAVPALPLLAALPSGPAPTWFGVMGLGVPLAAGAVGGVLLARRLRCAWGKAALEGLYLGPCVGALFAVLAWLSGGPLGGGRLTDVGPSWWQVFLALTVEVGVASAAAAALVRR